MDSIEARAVAALCRVPGGVAVVLGGSRAGGDHTASADYDLAAYFGPSLDLEALAACLAALDDDHRGGLLNPPGEWGPWICGGGWLTMDGMAVDVLLRDYDRVGRTLADCLAGRVTIDYQAGHPHGFVNAIYAAEVYYAQALWQRDGALDRLKAMVSTYPPAMGAALAAKFGWEAEFSYSCGSKAIAKSDLLYAAGSIYRGLACLVQVIFARHGVYLMNEKGAVRRAADLGILPGGFEDGLATLYRHLGAGDLAAAFGSLAELMVLCR